MNNPLAGTDPTGYEPEIEEHVVKFKFEGSRRTVKVKVKVTSENGKITNIDISSNSRRANAQVGAKFAESIGSQQGISLTSSITANKSQSAASNKKPGAGSSSSFLKEVGEELFNNMGDYAGLVGKTAAQGMIDDAPEALKDASGYNDTVAIVTAIKEGDKKTILISVAGLLVSRVPGGKVVLKNVTKSAGQLGREGEAAASAITGVGTIHRSFL